MLTIRFMTSPTWDQSARRATKYRKFNPGLRLHGLLLFPDCFHALRMKVLRSFGKFLLSYAAVSFAYSPLPDS